MIVTDNGDGTLTGDATDNGDGTLTSAEVVVNGDTLSAATITRDIDVTASPIFSGWAAGLVTAYPEVAGKVFQGDGWKPGTVTGYPETAGKLINKVTAGAVWIQE